MTEHKLSSLNMLVIEIEKRIDEFDAKRRVTQKWHTITSLGQMLTTAITTILIAINVKVDCDYLSYLAIFASTLSGLFGSFLAKFMFSERLSHSISVICNLRELRFNISLGIEIENDDPEGNKITIEKVEEYKKDYQKIVDQANSTWQENFKKSKKRK